MSFDDIVGKGKEPKTTAKRKIKTIDQSQIPVKGYGGINENDGYSWIARITKEGFSIVEIVLVDEIGKISDDTIDDIIKKLRGV